MQYVLASLEVGVARSPGPISIMYRKEVKQKWTNMLTQLLKAYLGKLKYFLLTIRGQWCILHWNPLPVRLWEELRAGDSSAGPAEMSLRSPLAGEESNCLFTGQKQKLQVCSSSWAATGTWAWPVHCNKKFCTHKTRWVHSVTSRATLDYDC